MVILPAEAGGELVAVEGFSKTFPALFFKSIFPCLAERNGEVFQGRLDFLVENRYAAIVVTIPKARRDAASGRIDRRSPARRRRS